MSRCNEGNERTRTGTGKERVVRLMSNECAYKGLIFRVLLNKTKWLVRERSRGVNAGLYGDEDVWWWW